MKSIYYQGTTMKDEFVTYTLEFDGKIVVVEHVPARVDSQTGERFFAPETVERLQQVVWEQRQPKRMIEAPVFEFAV